MSDLEKAARDAADAEANARQLELITAVLQAQQLLQAQQPAPAPAPRPEFDTKKWVTIGGLAIVGGGVASVLAVAFAAAMIALAIGATCATGSFVILRSIWRETQKRR